MFTAAALLPKKAWSRSTPGRISTTRQPERSLSGNNTGGADVSLVWAAANTANATANATNLAYVTGTNFGSLAQKKTGKPLYRRLKPTSYAKAGFIDNDVNVSLVGLGILVMTADAKRAFKAWLDSTGSNVYVANLSITNTYKAISEAKSTQPGKGVGVSLVDGDGILAEATTPLPMQVLISLAMEPSMRLVSQFR